MSTEISGSATPVAITRSGQVSLSKWVNEKLPPLTELLSAHEVARLTRRHRWMLSALALLGRFPKQERFRGRAIGWHRRDVERWLRSDGQITTCVEFVPWPLSSARTVAAWRARTHTQSCTQGPANRTRCSRRRRRRQRHGWICGPSRLADPLTAVTRRPNEVGVTLPLAFAERSEP